MLNTEERVECTSILKQATRQNHRETEAALLPLLKGIRSFEAYAAVLRDFYGFYHPLEQLIEKRIGKELLPDIEQRRKSEWIIRDLEQLGFPAPVLSCNDLPAVNDPLQAFGALYVLEGSTLGGAIICKMLLANPHLHLPEAAFTFFRGYGTASAARWEQFRNDLNRAVGPETEPVVVAANETFLLLKQWILKNQ